MTEIDRTTPVGLARYAREYFDSALAADKVVGERKGYEIVAPAPVMFLIAHAIELALKAYLRNRGATLAEIKGIGHNLLDCWQESVEKGIEEFVKLSEEDVGVLELISDLHSSTELRYIQTGFKQFPVFGLLESLARKILDTVCPLVGYR